VPNITRIPAPRVPLIDERTGYVSREWFRFFNNLFVLTGSGSNQFSIGDLELAPNTDAQLQANVDTLQSEIEALQILPPPQQMPAANYGMFYNTTTFTAAAINTAYPITFNTTAYAQGVYIGSPTSHILCNRPGLYNFAFSAQIDRTSGGTGNIWFWGRKNGTDIAQSASRVQIQGNNAELVVTVNFYVEMSNGDYFQLMYAVDDLSVIILTEAPTAFAPAVPSVILTVNQVNL
jgi:hypothetical protein